MVAAAEAQASKIAVGIVVLSHPQVEFLDLMTDSKLFTFSSLFLKGSVICLGVDIIRKLRIMD